jgi:hypothetical protein
VHPTNSFIQRILSSALVPASLAFLLYVATLPPSVLWGGGDFARLQLWAATLHLEGGALGHPLWVLLAHPFTYLPVGDTAFRASLATAVMGAAGLGLFFALVRDLTRSVPAGWLATGALGVTHMYWTYSVMPKVYALNALLLIAALWLASRWQRDHRPRDLFAMALALGVGVHAHLLFVVLVPAFLVFVLLERRDESLLTLSAALATVAGLAATYLLWPADGGVGLAALAEIHVRGLVGVLTSPTKLALGIGVLAALVAYQFLFSLLLVPRGILSIRQDARSFFWLLLMLAVSDVAFVWSWIPQTPTLSTYVQNWHFYLPLVVVLALWVGIGVARWWPSLTRRARGALAVVMLGVPVVTYALAPVFAGGAVDRIGLRSLPGRDNAVYLLSPWKHTEDGARPHGEDVLGALPEGATVFADYSIYWVLRYLREEAGIREDVRLVELPIDLEDQLDVVSDAQPGSRLFITDTNRYYAVSDFEPGFTITNAGPVWELVPRN